MTISKSILFATLILGVNVANATADATNCAMAKQSALTRNPEADRQLAKNLTGQNDAPVNAQKPTQTADAAAR